MSLVNRSDSGNLVIYVFIVLHNKSQSYARIYILKKNQTIFVKIIFVTRIYVMRWTKIISRFKYSKHWIFVDIICFNNSQLIYILNSSLQSTTMLILFC